MNCKTLADFHAFVRFKCIGAIMDRLHDEDTRLLLHAVVVEIEKDNLHEA